MNALARLADPAFAKDAPIRLNARALGFVIAAVGALYCLGTPLDLALVRGTGLAAVGEIVLLTPLPQLVALVGGARMWHGDSRGKRLVVLSLAAGFVWSTATYLLPMDDLGFGFVGALSGWLLALTFNLAIAAFLYYVVATSEFRGSARLRDVLSVAGLLVGCAAIVIAVIFGLLTWAIGA